MERLVKLARVSGLALLAAMLVSSVASATDPVIPNPGDFDIAAHITATYNKIGIALGALFLGAYGLLVIWRMWAYSKKTTRAS